MKLRKNWPSAKRYRITGSIQPGQGRGRVLGYPTVNLPVTRSVPHGVYAGYVYWQRKKYPAAIFIGAAITFGETQVQAEAHILADVAAVLKRAVRRPITIECVQWLRANKKFRSVSALQDQMAVDIINIHLCLQGLSKKWSLSPHSSR